MERRFRVVDSPLGPLTLVSEEAVLVGLYQESQRHRPDKMTFGVRDDDCLGEVVEQLDEYFAGRLRKFDVAIGLSGTPFQLRVWNAPE